MQIPGSLQATEGTITFNGLIGGSFTNATDGTITAQQLDIGSVVGAAFENDGHITLGGSGTGISIGTSTIAVALTNTGTIDVQAGTLGLSGGTVTNGGLLEATSGGTLDVQDSEINNSGTEANGAPAWMAPSFPWKLMLAWRAAPHSQRCSRPAAAR